MVTILLVDDSKTVQKAAELALTKNQYDLNLATADDSSQALAKARELKPDAILIDHNLPLKNGYVLAAEFKKNLELKHIPIMLLVGPKVALDPQKAMSTGVSGALSKPFTAEDFNHALLSVLSNPVSIPDQAPELMPELIAEPILEPIIEPVIQAEPEPESQIEIAVETPAPPVAVDEPAPLLINPSIAEQLNRSEIEQMIRKVIEEVVWEVVPDLAESIIKEELNRLLKK
ncbi:MAG: response regulator [bacterium]|nr:response regulator [bacterium]